MAIRDTVITVGHVGIIELPRWDRPSPATRTSWSAETPCTDYNQELNFKKSLNT